MSGTSLAGAEQISTGTTTCLCDLGGVDFGFPVPGSAGMLLVRPKPRVGAGATGAEFLHFTVAERPVLVDGTLGTLEQTSTGTGTARLTSTGTGTTFLEAGGLGFTSCLVEVN